jgi:hypothetical protein
VNYNGLKIPIPQEEVINAYYKGTLKMVSSKYGVTLATVKKRLPEELQKKKGVYGTYTSQKSHPVSMEEATKAINAYYRSGRKLNATELSPNRLKQVLKAKGIPLKEGKSLPPRYQVALLDSLISSREVDLVPELTRKLYEFKTEEPQVWKGQVLDWYIKDQITQQGLLGLYGAIEDVAQYMGYED